MGASLCRPSCLKDNTGTIVSIKSDCFKRDLKIYINEEDEDMLKHLEEILDTIKRKQTIIKEKRRSESKENIEGITRIDEI